MRILPWLALVFLPARADVRNCLCDFSRPETLTARECSLCKSTEAQPPEPAFFVLRDTNPNKPNRQLALPRFHGHDLSDLTPAQRAAYWTFAIAKARETWGDGWGLAVNSLERRTQCHSHIHIGKLKDGVENDAFTVVGAPAEIPLPRDGDGLLVHPAGTKFHVHSGNDAPELLLER